MAIDWMVLGRAEIDRDAQTYAQDDHTRTFANNLYLCIREYQFDDWELVHTATDPDEGVLLFFKREMEDEPGLAFVPPE